KSRVKSQIDNRKLQNSSRFCLLAAAFIQCHRFANRHKQLITLLGGEVMLDKFLGVFKAGAFVKDVLVHEVLENEIVNRKAMPVEGEQHHISLDVWMNLRQLAQEI